MVNLKQSLERIYKNYDFKKRMGLDPISFPHRYKRKKDIEAAGFIAASLAYGRVSLFMPVIEKILRVMGKSPYDFLTRFEPKRQRALFDGIRYRLQKTEDIIAMLYVLSVILKTHGSIYNLFKKHYSKTDPDTGHALYGVLAFVSGIDTSPVYGRDIKPRGFGHLFPNPSTKGASKRFHLFLRWMIRDRDIDLGIWKGIPKSKLVIPLDTHIARASRRLGLTKRKTSDWKTAEEITASLKRFDPEDPLKYDFALCHMGMEGATHD